MFGGNLRGKFKQFILKENFDFNVPLGLFVNDVSPQYFLIH